MNSNLRGESFLNRRPVIKQFTFSSPLLVVVSTGKIISLANPKNLHDTAPESTTPAGQNQTRSGPAF